MIKKLLKRIIPSFFINLYRLHGKFFYYLNRVLNLKNQKNYILLIGTPLHENLGDHLITYAEKAFLNGLLDKKIIEIPIEVYKLLSKIIIKYTPQSIIILIQGGGWMGDTWPDDELLIQNIISSFPDNRIIVFPQSSYYENFENQLVESGKKIYKGENLFVFLRDENSYNTMKNLYPNLKIYLEPDIVMFIKGKIKLNSIKKKNNIGVCFRHDKEEKYKELKNIIIKFLNENNLPYKFVNTIANKPVSEDQRDEKVHKVIRDFSDYKLIITDRLHAMIISYIVNVPCIAIDNKTHKVSSLYKTWLNTNNKIFLIHNYDEFLKLIHSFETETEDISMFEFNTLRKVIFNG